MNHHLPDALLTAYAAGACTEAESVLVATHLTLCPACRRQVGQLEAVGGSLIEQEDPLQDGIEDLLAAAMHALDEPVAAPQPEPTAFDPSGILPAPLAQQVGALAELSWQRVFPGVERIEVRALQARGMPLRLFRLRAGMRVPDHEHRGREISVVLTGGFTDDDGHYLRGDVADRGEGVLHRQHIDPGEPCIVLVLADHPLVARSLRGRLARLFHTL